MNSTEAEIDTSTQQSLNSGDLHEESFQLSSNDSSNKTPIETTLSYFYNETDFMIGDSLSSNLTANSSQLSTNIPHNSILHEAISGYSYNETDFITDNSPFSSIYRNGNDSINNYSFKTAEIQTYNVTVFSNYPLELLCFGAICFVAFAVVGILGNFISILALSKCKRLRNATTAFIVNLCVADFLFCSFSIPMSAVSFIAKQWYFGDLLCKLFPLIRYSNGAVSVFSVIAITVNRYVLIVHPKLYPKVYSKRNMAAMIVLIWFLSLLLLMLPLLELWGTLGYDPTVGTCTILKLNGTSPKVFLYVAAFGLPSVIFVACYVRIFFEVRKASRKASCKEVRTNSGRISFSVRRRWLTRSMRHSEMAPVQSHHRDKRELRVLKLMLVIFILFLVCYFPVSFVKIFRKEDDLPILNVLGYLGVYFSNIINPVIYIVMSNEYRRAYKELFCYSEVKRQTIMVI